MTHKATSVTESQRNLSESILNLRRYLSDNGKMNYWEGDNDENRGIYVDLGAVMGHFKEFIQLFKEVITTTASHGDNCRCPIKMNEYAMKQILERFEKLVGKELIE